jgi:large subunit ribosomal protein L32
MGVPKQKHTKSRRNKRRSQIFLTAAVLSVCPKCKKPVLPHTVCKNCGSYNGHQAIDVMAKLTKKEQKAKEKEMAQKEEKKDLNLQELSKK